MKKEIVISEKNLSRYNKRTQKTLSSLLGRKVQLNEAAEVFSHILGLSNAYELKSLLEKDLNVTVNMTIDDSKTSTMDKLVLISKHIQKMLKDSKAEYWYAVFSHQGGDTNPFYGTPEYNGLKIYDTFIGLHPFDHKVYSPFPLEREFGDYKDILDEDIDWQCICSGDIDQDMENIKRLDDPEDKYLSKKKELYSCSQETRKIKELSDFAEEMLYKMVNKMKDSDDFILIEKNLITIQLGDETYSN